MEEVQEKKKLLQWHPAFFAGLQIELEEDAENLIFDNEFQLGKKPMAVDVLVVKKNKDLPVRKNIGQIFKKYNIIEYKSPEDSLTIDDFYKVYGYACIYKADTGTVDSIPVEELTITLASGRYPRKLIRHLRVVLHDTVRNVGKGIYYVEGEKIAIQIIVLSQLSKEENLWLSSLTNKLKEKKTVDDLLREFEKHRENTLYRSVMDMILHANKKVFEEVKGMYGFIQELYEDEFEEARKKFEMELNDEKEKTWNMAWGKAWDKAEDCLDALMQKLQRDSRTEDMIKAASDKEYRRKLYKEYVIKSKAELLLEKN